MLPQYLSSKLSTIDIISIEQIRHFGYLKVFKWLRDAYPSISYNALYMLYVACNNLTMLSSIQKTQILSDYKQQNPTYLPLKSENVNNFLLEAARYAELNNEVPVGAIVVKDNKIIARGRNEVINNCSIVSHAEINAIQNASRILNSYRLINCDMFVTTEPCLMCSGAIIHSRIRRLVFGAVEPKTGAVISQYQVFNNRRFNHHTEAIGPINNLLYQKPIQTFFKDKRL